MSPTLGGLESRNASGKDHAADSAAMSRKPSESENVCKNQAGVRKLLFFQGQICVCVCTSMHMCLHACVCVCVHVCVVCACMFVPIVCMCCVCVCVCVCMCVCVCVLEHACMKCLCLYNDQC